MEIEEYFCRQGPLVAADLTAETPTGVLAATAQEVMTQGEDWTALVEEVDSVEAKGETLVIFWKMTIANRIPMLHIVVTAMIVAMIVAQLHRLV